MSEVVTDPSVLDERVVVGSDDAMADVVVILRALFCTDLFPVPLFCMFLATLVDSDDGELDESEVFLFTGFP